MRGGAGLDLAAQSPCPNGGGTVDLDSISLSDLETSKQRVAGSFEGGVGVWGKSWRNSQRTPGEAGGCHHHEKVQPTGGRHPGQGRQSSVAGTVGGWLFGN